MLSLFEIAAEGRMEESYMKKMGRTNIYLAIVLNIITVGFYSIFWLHQRTLYLNKKVRSEKIPRFLVYACYGLWIPEALSITPTYLFSLFFMFKILLLFSIRSEIHNYFKISDKNKHWFSALYTFFFGFLYFVYKIDQFPTKNNTPNDQQHSA